MFARLDLLFSLNKDPSKHDASGEDNFVAEYLEGPKLAQRESGKVFKDLDTGVITMRQRADASAAQEAQSEMVDVNLITAVI